MSTAYYLFIDAQLSLEEFVRLLGFPKEDILPPVIEDEVDIELDEQIFSIRVLSDKDYNRAGLYGIKSNVRVSIIRFGYETLLELTANLVRTTFYDLGIFTSSRDEPILVRKNQKLTLNADPDRWIDEWLDIFKDIPHEMAEF